MSTYDWPAAGQFRNRTIELERLERWYDSDSLEPLSMWGRRRVGKSWLFRRLAHGKPAVILVADRVSQGLQLERMARDLEPLLGVTPRLNDVGDLFAALYRLARDTRTLVVIDEFPYLLGSSTAEQSANLTRVQSVMEQERDNSQIRLLLAGSTISTMQDLQSERNPLHGRLVPFEVKPLRFEHARLLMGDARNEQGPVDQLTHFSISGGMPRYLTALAGSDLARGTIFQVLDPSGPLFNEPRTLLTSELREPAMYFSILAALAIKPAQAAEISSALHLESRDLTVYLHTLESLHLVTRYEPVGAKKGTRGTTRWRCDDDFIRFWFRFVQPAQGELEGGADPEAFYAKRVAPYLADHASLTFERTLCDWLRQRYRDDAPHVGSWWGPALNSLRKTKERLSEEIDGVVLDGKKVLAVGEAKWTNKALGADVLTDLDNYKIPALAQAGLQVSGLEIVLASRSGFTPALLELAEGRTNVRLLEASALLTEL